MLLTLKHSPMPVQMPTNQLRKIIIMITNLTRKKMEQKEMQVVMLVVDHP